MPPQPYVFQPFPSCRYGPNGEAEIFETEADVPEGWEDHPSKVGQKAAKEAAKEADKVVQPTLTAAEKKAAAAEKKAAAATAAAAEKAAKEAAKNPDGLDEKSDEELSEILLGYGLESDGADRETILAVIRDESAKAG